MQCAAPTPWEAPAGKLWELFQKADRGIAQERLRSAGRSEIRFAMGGQGSELDKDGITCADSREAADIQAPKLVSGPPNRRHGRIA